jgi:hypothetical protein
VRVRESDAAWQAASTEAEQLALLELALSRAFKLGGLSLPRQLVELLLLDVEARLVGGRAYASLSTTARAQHAALFRSEYECLVLHN